MSMFLSTFSSEPNPDLWAIHVWVLAPQSSAILGRAPKGGWSDPLLNERVDMGWVGESSEMAERVSEQERISMAVWVRASVCTIVARRWTTSLGTRFNVILQIWCHGGVAIVLNLCPIHHWSDVRGRKNCPASKEINYLNKSFLVSVSCLQKLFGRVTYLGWYIKMNFYIVHVYWWSERLNARASERILVQWVYCYKCCIRLSTHPNIWIFPCLYNIGQQLLGLLTLSKRRDAA